MPGFTTFVLDIQHRVANCFLLLVISNLIQIVICKVKMFSCKMTGSNDAVKRAHQEETGPKRQQGTSESPCKKPKRTSTAPGTKSKHPKEKTQIISKARSARKDPDPDDIVSNVTAVVQRVKRVEPQKVTGTEEKSSKRKCSSPTWCEKKVKNQKLPKTEKASPRKKISDVHLDQHNCDLNICIDECGLSARSLNHCEGLQLLWGGARANRGVYQGEIFFEVRITEEFKVDELASGGAVLRVGWSSDSSSLELGEDSWSYCYCSSGEFICGRYSTAYGGRFKVNDVIGAMLQVKTDGEPARISFMKNGRDLGEATTLPMFPKIDERLALFPHIALKNCKAEVNFGDRRPWYPPPEGFSFIGHRPLSETVPARSQSESASNCEMIRLVAKAGAEAKSDLIQKIFTSSPEKKYIVLSCEDLCQRMDVVGLPKRLTQRRVNHLGHIANECLIALMNIVSAKRRNCIVDDVNLTDESTNEILRIFQNYEQRKISYGSSVGTSSECKQRRFASEFTSESWGDECRNEVW